jgi:hypothetical protein
MLHLAIIGTLGATAATASLFATPVGFALGALALGLGLMARGD